MLVGFKGCSSSAKLIQQGHNIVQHLSGASLESLAKGAVQFSQRFTVQELQDRWHSLLYDPIVSMEASVSVIEFEHATSPLLSNYRREKMKGDNSFCGKRNAETVRKCYYAMRKRICNEDLSLLVAPGNNDSNVENAGEPVYADCMLEESIHNEFGYEVSNFDVVHHAFPDLGTGGGASTSIDITTPGFCNEFYDYDEVLHADQNSNNQDEIPFISEDNVSVLGEIKELPACNLFEADDLEAKSPSMSGYIFGVYQALNSPFPSCGAPFHNFRYPSPLPQIPIWSTSERIAVPILPDVDLGGEESPIGCIYSLPDNGNTNNINRWGDNVIESEPKLKNQMSSDNLKNSTPATDDYLAELSNSLLNFTSEDELIFVDAEGKDTIDKSYIEGLSSLLLDSPNENDRPFITVSAASVCPGEYMNITDGSSPGALGDKRQYHCGYEGIHRHSKSLIELSATAVNPEFPNGIICCTLNTEDPEIPCNEDVFLTIQMPSSSHPSQMQWKLWESYLPTSSSITILSGSQKHEEGDPSLTNFERSGNEQSQLSSQMIESSLGPNLLIGDHGVKFDLPDNNVQYFAFRNSSMTSGGLGQILPANVRIDDPLADNLLAATVKKEVTESEQAFHISCEFDELEIEKQAYGSDYLLRCPEKNGCCSEQVVHATATSQKHERLLTRLDTGEVAVPEAVVKASPSSQEEFPSESDDAVPNFSDVEAMILDTDLSPDDQDWSSTRDVGMSRYQHEDTMRAIIRLEQAADACIQRAVASQGAFAVLYGLHSKHYIKKPEVLLGRGTEDFYVDIDLGRENRRNKVSRRQAIIKMDTGGCFHLTNLGSFSIFVNGKEIERNETVSLTSSCLIEG
ncbi:hypothetical protein RJ639_023960 [Escallonia herrerae]|uniref:FHA domain-containing protein n=1 Tax=Escallonia herrerae TaxID=1293975 RepID=A0AA88UYX5_9ASTE|nr:hypothetical protein RJ639_023960 [Escallonia herrerae]